MCPSVTRVPTLATCGWDDCKGTAGVGSGDQPWACNYHKTYGETRYPVLVTYTHEHVVWVEAESQADALRQMQDAPYEHTSDGETLARLDMEVTAPDKWEWDTVEWGGESYRGTKADAHVKTHREYLRQVKRDADKVVCAAAGHPDARPNGANRWCPICWQLPAATS